MTDYEFNTTPAKVIQLEEIYGRLDRLEKEVDRVKYYTKVECAHCGKPTPLAYAHRFESRNFGRLFNGLFCEKCLGEYNELEYKLREDLFSKFGDWHKSNKKK